MSESMQTSEAVGQESSCGACGHRGTRRSHPARSAVGGEAGVFVECDACGTLRVQSKVDYDALYANRDSGNYAGIRKGLASRVFAALKQAYLGTAVSKYLARARPTDRVLDYGCGSGELANAIRTTGFQSLVAADVQQDRPSVLDPAIPYAALHDLPAHGRYRFILMRHVLEHVQEPAAALRGLFDLLEPGGSLIVEVPCDRSIYRSLMGSRWPGYYFPFHVFVFSESGLRELARQTGLAVERVEHCNPPMLGTFFLSLGLPLSASRGLAMALYPLQWVPSVLTARPEAIRLTLVRPA